MRITRFQLRARNSWKRMWTRARFLPNCSFPTTHSKAASVLALGIAVTCYKLLLNARPSRAGRARPLRVRCWGRGAPCPRIERESAIVIAKWRTNLRGGHSKERVKLRLGVGQQGCNQVISGRYASRHDHVDLVETWTHQTGERDLGFDGVNDHGRPSREGQRGWDDLPIRNRRTGGTEAGSVKHDGLAGRGSGGGDAADETSGTRSL